jgi:SAM-dependent methyltransferase
MPNKKEAMEYPRGNIALGYCSGCGFIANTAFDPQVQEYSTRYEETQGYSSCFNAFAKSLAGHLINRYGLRNKDILEIGCGKGEFLTLLCKLGNNRGIGIDPSFIPERNPASSDLDIKFIQDFYSEKYHHLTADFICCRHTLEHIPQTGEFLRRLRRTIGDKTDTLIFFEVPDTLRILREGAFWDIYYEHCSYFSPGSLAQLFRASGFTLVDLSLGFDEQYVLLTAKPGKESIESYFDLENDLTDMTMAVYLFNRICASKTEWWRNRITGITSGGKRVVIWGSGSKGVAFLTTLKGMDQIEYVVDINPYRQGKYIPGTGQEIVSPKFLMKYKPHHIIVMNPIYRREIQAELDRMKIKAELLPVY